MVTRYLTPGFFYVILDIDRNKYREVKMEKSPVDAPLRIPFRCVVCSGFGTLKSGTLICHACGGKGYVVVDQIVNGEEEYANA